MEHEINRLIREKVEIAEGLPAAWNKDRVWQVIRAERAPRSHRPFYYYAAASVVAAILAIFIGIQDNYQKQTAARIAALESMINRDPQVVSSGLLSQETSVTCPDNNPMPAVKKTAYKVHPKERPQYVDHLSEIVTEEKKDQPEIELGITPVSESNSEVESLAVVNTPPAQVQAIIGFIPAPREVVFSPKVKKSRLRIFRNHNTEDNTLPLEETTLLTARIN